ncbi:hypothetical protein QBC44DRAFT_264123, partial [Cladorrhinum sp. PSN332]
MMILDPVSLQCLRRTGHWFFTTFELYFIWPVQNAKADTKYLPWPRPPMSVLEAMTDAESKAMVALLRRDEFCLDCSASRHLPNWPHRVSHTTKRYLHCSGCQRDHPICLFTPAQRELEQRLCVGHTGHIRLCDHQVVTWSQVVAASKTIGNKAHYVIAECKKRSHLGTCQLQRKLFRNNNNNNNFTPSVCPEYPQLVLLNTRAAGLSIKLCWSPHLDLRPLKISPYPAVTINSMFARLRQRQTRYICPQIEPSQAPIESMIFDPGSCDCFSYHNIKPLYNVCGRLSRHAHGRLAPLQRAQERPRATNERRRRFW